MLTWILSLSEVFRFGFANTWGVFQSYYETDLLSNTSPSTMCVTQFLNGVFGD